MKYGAGVQEDQKFDNMNLRSYLVIRQYLLTTTTTTKIVILCCNGDFVRKRWRICRFRNRCNFIEICRSSYAQFSESEQKANMYYSPRNGWFRKDDVCAGYIISLTCALRSLTPTSIPVTWRDRLHQGRIQQESDPVGCVGALQREQQGMLEYSFSRLFVPWNVRSRTIRSRERINTADLSLLGLDLGVTRSSFCGSARKFCGWLAGSSRKIRLRFSNVSSIDLSVRSSSC